jgi:hypothetical protein
MGGGGVIKKGIGRQMGVALFCVVNVLDNICASLEAFAFHKNYLFLGLTGKSWWTLLAAT